MKGKEKNDLERFKEYPQQITPPPGLDAPAARLTEELYGKKAAEKKERRARLVRRRLLPSLAIILVLLIPLCIGLPTMMTLDEDEEHYYLGEDLTAKIVTDELPLFMEKHGVGGRYFEKDALQTTNTAYYLIETNQLMYLLQEALFLSDSGLDSISLGIVFTNDTFEQFNDFVDLPEETQIAGVEVDYKTETANGMDVVRSRFSYEQVSYFLEITTISADGVLEQYITDLLS